MTENLVLKNKVIVRRWTFVFILKVRLFMAETLEITVATRDSLEHLIGLVTAIEKRGLTPRTPVSPNWPAVLAYRCAR